jgi:hypothetical protein
MEVVVKLIRGVMSHLSIAGELLGFTWQKRRWLVPLILVLLVIGFLIALASATGIAPFIYTLF